MEICKTCKFNKEDSPFTYRICMACEGDPDEAYDKVFNPKRKDRKLWHE